MDQDTQDTYVPTTPDQKIDRLGRRLFELKMLEAYLEGQLKQVAAEIHAISTKDLAGIMDNAEVSKRKLDGIGSIYLADEIFVNVLKADRPKLHEWAEGLEKAEADRLAEAKKNGEKGWEPEYAGYVQKHIFPQSLSKLAKLVASKGDALPPFIKLANIPVVKTRREAQSDD